MQALALESLPGFRRRFRVTPGPGWVRSEVEDDYHCMGVTLHHDGKFVTAIDPELLRAPWTTCPGAPAQLKQTFTGVALDAFAARGDKTANCTHLYDIALLAAAHALDAQPLVYDVLVADAIDGQRRAEVRRDGVPVLAWTESAFRISEPVELAGMTLDKLRPWIDSLTPDEQEAARLLRWANMIANGRQIPIEQQSDAKRMPSNCYTFQPERKVIARRVGVIRDFSKGSAQPLDGMAVDL
ncbi:MAG: hypothetical protein JWQ90_1097 [Hydrocarboniphaga sp.]|uniref:hypothetical protein n=1 Tax=Hydrocarboniphaga sp. TaxID=2033016 RepID=UPI002631D40D|nr:hypothetical protein [Hydrocarboniphaga sp.]MDB5968647.1 hypothetical protein [Hydrocarboniphaga sp.]